MKPTIKRKFDDKLRYIPPETIFTTYIELLDYNKNCEEEPGYFRLCFVVQGRSRLHLHNHTYPIIPGMLLLLPAEWPCSLKSEDSEPLGVYYCYFQLKEGELDYMDLRQSPLFVYVQEEQSVYQLFSKLIDMQSLDTFASRLRMKATLLELIAYFHDELENQLTVVNETDFDVKWNEVLLYIEANLHTNIQVEELARLAFLHPNYFITSFKNMMGCSPIQYVTQRRIASAKRLLAETELSIAEVASRVGMQNHYLSRLFKRYTGKTPVQYRKIVKLGHRRVERKPTDLPEKGEQE
jgi:AraC-like DNA-binding protein